jgi:hypothetical protein
VAVNRKQKQTQDGATPDAAAFVRLIDEGLAEPRAVVLAYFQAVNEANAGKTDAEVLRGVKIVQEYPGPPDPNDPGNRLVLLYRELVVFGGDA